MAPLRAEPCRSRHGPSLAARWPPIQAREDHSAKLLTGWLRPIGLEPITFGSGGRGPLRSRRRPLPRTGKGRRPGARPGTSERFEWPLSPGIRTAWQVIDRRPYSVASDRTMETKPDWRAAGSGAASAWRGAAITRIAPPPPPPARISWRPRRRTRNGARRQASRMPAQSSGDVSTSGSVGPAEVDGDDQAVEAPGGGQRLVERPLHRLLVPRGQARHPDALAGRDPGRPRPGAGRTGPSRRPGTRLRPACVALTPETPPARGRPPAPRPPRRTSGPPSRVPAGGRSA